jgi:hypothetical protein
MSLCKCRQPNSDFIEQSKTIVFSIISAAELVALRYSAEVYRMTIFGHSSLAGDAFFIGYGLSLIEGVDA